MACLEAERILHVQVACAPAIEIGPGPDGFHRVIPITGGRFEGEIEGEVVPGVADWSVRSDSGDVAFFAKYLLKTDDGAYIEIENEEKLTAEQGGRIKTRTRFCADCTGNCAWLNTGAYVGELEVAVNPAYAMELNIYKLR